jgi:predicted AAA+ superfamily ATPase
MAPTNYERVTKAMELLRDGLGPYVQRELAALPPAAARDIETRYAPEDRAMANRRVGAWDVAALLKLMLGSWEPVFGRTLGNAERNLAFELRDLRNRWAHQEKFSGDDAYRALDSAARLLAAVTAPQADEVEKMKQELLRLRFDEQVRSEMRKGAEGTIPSAAAAALKPWREVVTPHEDVASGRYQQAEFAADLWQVHLGGGTAEYRDPAEFFRRTYLTASLKALLAGAVKRLGAGGGDPVVQLQTNFGGGKTHSMLALYHLFSGAPANEMAGVEGILHDAGGAALPAAQRVVLVGNKISPGNPVVKPDGTVVNTLWGELAWQLGGKRAYDRIRADDELATSPGDALRELFDEYGPCLILIDEWVAYARQLHDRRDLPAGDFETQFSFAQVLTESARAARNTLLVISLPASDTSGSPHAMADDVEVGGQRGREALDRLRNVIGRLEASWRPASAEEGFEIVRRRLFEPMTDPAHFKDRDVVARAFADLYRSQHQEFPPECREADYEARIKAAYPIHPEIFDRLYSDWSTLVKFQRTRGVLRLMAAVIHSLWEKGDRNPLIMPANLPIDDPRVQFELTRYLSDNWPPVIEKDVDGPSSLPVRMDGEVTNLGKFAATRRVARTIYLGSAPTADAAHRGLEDRRVKLGCVMPGEQPAVFGDALRRLAGAATYLYQDGGRYWYSTQATVTKVAEDRAEQLKRDPDRVAQELEKRLRADLRTTGGFGRIHPMPQSGQDVPDDLDARLVVLDAASVYGKGAGSDAEKAAREILEKRGNTPRLYRNALVFLAADGNRYQDLDEAVRRFLAWDGILAEREQLNLAPLQVRQAEAQRAAADSTVTARLPETYQWLLVPVQATPQTPMEWQALRLTGTEALAVRAARKLRGEELLVTGFAASRLRMELDRVPLWRGDHVPVRQLVQDFGRYTYLPRLADPGVLLEAVRSGVSLLTWEQDGFGFADSYDEAAGRYRGLRGGQHVSLPDAEAPGLLVRPDVARRQLDAEVAAARAAAEAEERARRAAAGAGGAEAGGGDDGRGGVEGGGAAEPAGGEPGRGSGGVQPPVAPQPVRFHGTVTLDPGRAGRDAARIAEEVIVHLAGLLGARVTVTLEIEAEIPGGAPEQVVRTVTENARALRFSSQGFERE